MPHIPKFLLILILFTHPTPSDSTKVYNPCSEFPGGGPSHGIEIFGIEEPEKNPWDSYKKLALKGKIRELVQAADSIELLVPYDRNNQAHYSKWKAKETQRKDIIFYGYDTDYFRYLTPAVKIEETGFNQIKEILLRPDAYLDGSSGPRFATVITGPRHVLRIKSSDQEIFVTISKVALPSIWVSGESIDNFGGLLHPDTEAEWHQLIEGALDNSGYRSTNLFDKPQGTLNR